MYVHVIVMYVIDQKPHLSLTVQFLQHLGVFPDLSERLL